MKSPWNAAERALRKACGAGAANGMDAVLATLPRSDSRRGLQELDWGADAERCVLAFVETLDAEPLPAESEELWICPRLERWHDRVDGCQIACLVGTESTDYASPIEEVLWQMPEDFDAPCASWAAKRVDAPERDVVLVCFAALLALELFARVDERLLPGPCGGLGITAGFELGLGVHIGFHDGTEHDSSRWNTFGSP